MWEEVFLLAGGACGSGCSPCPRPAACFLPFALVAFCQVFVHSFVPPILQLLARRSASQVWFSEALPRLQPE